MDSGVGEGESFDVVIVGGGTAGCILAARLSEDPGRSVLLVEAGPDFRGIDDCPAQVIDETIFPFDMMWAYDAVATERDPHHVVAVRGRILGGSGSVNGMLYTRADPADYDAWGSALWTNEALRPVFERIERDLDVPDGVTRAHGQVPLRRVPPEELAPVQVAFMDAALASGHQQHDDLLVNEHDGVGTVPRNCLDGVRMSMAHCYLNPVRDRPNLTVRGDTTVARVLVEEGRAVGIEVVDGDAGSIITAGEVILAAGGIGSPHLLTLSGIGPRDVLERLGIPVVAELAGVGRNLTDHAVVEILATLRPGVASDDARPVTAVRYTSPGSPQSGDMYLLAMTGDEPVQVKIIATLHLPESIGAIEVRSADPTEQPVVHFGYLGTERDVERLRHAVRHAVELLETDAFRSIVEGVVAPPAGALGSDAALTAWIERSVGTMLHSAGTCKMGDGGDPDAVVDERGRVLGVAGLRVMDFSVAPIVVRAPTNATAMAIGERMAELFREDALVPDRR
jgi:choline dehydrogenase